jgi:hypothetical protein
VELVEQNRGPLGTGKTALQIARRIIQVMKPQALVGLCTDLICDKPAIEPVTISKTDLGANVVAYQVNFVTFEWSDEVLSQVSMPIIAAAGGPAPVATMTCATAYADIWYTTDDSPPVPTSCDTLSTALLYRGPIALAEGKLTFRARGFLAGSIGSITNREVVETIAV